VDGSCTIGPIRFTRITFARLPKYTLRKRMQGATVITNGYKELQMVFGQVRKSFRLSIFLIGFFFIMMGLLTVMFMAAIYGKKELGLDDNVLIPTILVIQLVGMFGSWLFARLSGRFGNLKAFLASLIVWIFICIGIVMEKLATVAGTFSFGIIEAITGSMRYSVLAICIFFMIGSFFMLLLLRKGY
jgi:UMF1 family MFS transporter